KNDINERVHVTSLPEDTERTLWTGETRSDRVVGMSALGQKQTFAPQNVMSALPPKADMCGATRDVRFGPIADIAGTMRSPRQCVETAPKADIQSLIR